MCKITIDGLSVQIESGVTILEAAQMAGVNIPTLCYLKDLNEIASCRVCVVEVEGYEYPLPACATRVFEGMKVVTKSEKLCSYRQIALDLIVSDCGAKVLCPTSEGVNELRELCFEYGVTEPTFESAQSEDYVLDSNPLIAFDSARCIACQRCVGACSSGAHNRSISVHKQGTRTSISAPFGENWRETVCETCGCCVQACPTGALRMKGRKDSESFDRIRTTCPHCGVGCQLDLVVNDGCIVHAQGAQGPSNKGLLCVKGRSASFDFIDSPDRLRTPLVKNRETGLFEETSWDEALGIVAHRMTDLRDRYGGRSLAAFGCSRSTNEDLYLFQKMARTTFKTNNVDCCARV